MFTRYQHTGIGLHPPVIKSSKVVLPVHSVQSPYSLTTRETMAEVLDHLVAIVGFGDMLQH